MTLGPGKEYLVTGHMRQLMEQYGIASIEALLTAMPSDDELLVAVIDAMTTRERLWCRDEKPYRLLRDHILPDLVARCQSARIWSTACSTGQEPYSLAVELAEYERRFPGGLPSVESGRQSVLSTDMSESAVRSANKGIYQQFAIRRGLSGKYLRRYFTPLPGDRWVAGEAIRSRVTFQPHNLQASYEPLGQFDVIFCRNVLIYFSTDLKYEVIRRLHGSLAPSGYLVLGESESALISTMDNAGDLFERVPHFYGVVYRSR